jgi:hypothetical protein
MFVCHPRWSHESVTGFYYILKWTHDRLSYTDSFCRVCFSLDLSSADDEGDVLLITSAKYLKSAPSLHLLFLVFDVSVHGSRTLSGSFGHTLVASGWSFHSMWLGVWIVMYHSLLQGVNSDFAGSERGLFLWKIITSPEHKLLLQRMFYMSLA